MVSHLKCDLLFVSNCLIIIRILGGRESVCRNGTPVFPAFMELTAVGIMTPAVFVIGSCPLTQHYTTGNPFRFRCACSVYTEKPEETNRVPTIKKRLKGLPTRHDAGVSLKIKQNSSGERVYFRLLSLSRRSHPRIHLIKVLP